MTKRHKADPARLRERKIVPFNLRVAASEKAAFERAAEIAGVPVSAWVRERLRAAALRELDNVGEVAPFLSVTVDHGGDE